MTRRTLTSMLFLALLLTQGAAALCGIRCLQPKAMNAASCHGMPMADPVSTTHVATPCEHHLCPVDTLDALLEDHSIASHGLLKITSLPPAIWPDAVQPTGPPPARTLPPAPYHPLTDSLRV